MKNVSCRAKTCLALSAGDIADGILSPVLETQVLYDSVLCKMRLRESQSGWSLEKYRIREI